MAKRVFLIVLDSLGIGGAPDAKQFGDEGSDTLKSVSNYDGFLAPHLVKAGLFNLTDYHPHEAHPNASFARMQEKSAGKDTTIGHWEIAGIVSSQPLPTYPNGFPSDIMNLFTQKTGYGFLCNRPYSGTQVIKDFGEEHRQTKKVIVYTSADSVFQIAAHEDIIPIDELYRICEITRQILVGKHGVGRVIARPFTTIDGQFVRTENRRDFSLEPPSDTMLDYIVSQNMAVLSVGKIYDIFCGKSITKRYIAHTNPEGMHATLQITDEDFHGLCFINLVDFDMLYGHRNDIAGYAKALMAFDTFLPQLRAKMRAEDILIITADHGCDPATPSTDHSRECTPMLIMGDPIQPGIFLKTRVGFCDIAKTILSYLEIDNTLPGVSFYHEVKKQ